MAEYVKLPKIGLTMKTGKISDIKKTVGDAVRKGEVVAEFETDKITGEAESPIDGTVLQILAAVGDEIEVLSPIALIGEPGEQPIAAQAPVAQGTAPAAEAAAAAPVAPAETKTQEVRAASAGGRILAMPLAKRYARELGIELSSVAASSADGIVRKKDVERALQSSTVRATPLAKKIAKETGIDLRNVAGTGPGGRISKDDVLAASKETVPAAPAAVAAPAGGVRRKRMTGMRRVIAERLSESKRTIPHVYFKSEMDATALLAMKETLKDAAGKGLAPKITVNDLLLKAVAASLKKLPDMYAQLDGEDIVYFDEINLGMAVSVEGGLIVPVIKNAGALSLGALAKVTAALADKARTGKLAPEDYTGGNFTVSNLGASGIDEFSAIINPPEAAILAVGVVKEKAVVLDGQVAVRPMMTLTLSVDHRIIDGALAAEFMKTLKQSIENICLVLI